MMRLVLVLASCADARKNWRNKLIVGGYKQIGGYPRYSKAPWIAVNPNRKEFVYTTIRFGENPKVDLYYRMPFKYLGIDTNEKTKAKISNIAKSETNLPNQRPQ